MVYLFTQNNMQIIDTTTKMYEHNENYKLKKFEF